MLDCKIEKYLINSFGLIDASGYKVLKITEGLSGADVYILEILKPKRHRYRGSYIPVSYTHLLSRWKGDPVSDGLTLKFGRGTV